MRRGSNRISKNILAFNNIELKVKTVKILFKKLRFLKFSDVIVIFLIFFTIKIVVSRVGIRLKPFAIAIY